MINCSNCGLENDDSFAFCVRCGSSLNTEEEKPLVAPTPQIKECPQCGSRIPKMFRFCGSCGHAFEDEKKESPPRPPRAPQVTSYDLKDSGTTGGHRAILPPIPRPPSSERTITGERRSITGEEPARPREHARLVVINKDGTEGESIPIKGPVMKLGRASEFAALSGDPCLSPLHVIIEEKEGDFLLTDADSLNGVFVSVPPEPVPLEHGDQLRFGRQLIEFRTIEREHTAEEEEDGVRRIGSENPNYWGLLSVISHPEIDCQIIPIASDICIIGREKGDITMPNDFYVSGRHLEIRRVGETYFVRDLNSSNGTYLRLKHPHTVKPNEKIMMGQQLFVVRKD